MLLKSRAGDEGQRRDGGWTTDPLPCVIPVGMPKAAELVKSGKVDVFVPTRQTSSQYQISCPALEVLTADFPLTGREAGTAYVRKFIENVKAEGLEKAGLRGAVEE
jgi:molybdate-binding protein